MLRSWFLLLFKKIRRFFRKLFGLSSWTDDYWVKAPSSFSRSCEAIVLHCVDYRYRSAVTKYCEGRFGKYGFDIIVLPGGAKACLDDRAEFVLSHIKMCLEKHRAKQIMVFGHLDCVIYDLIHSPKTVIEEAGYHFADFRNFKFLLEKDFGKPVTTLLVSSDNGLIKIETIDQSAVDKIDQPELILEPVC